jgi:hybrid cluster-associated redox disulfide protein
MGCLEGVGRNNLHCTYQEMFVSGRAEMITTEARIDQVLNEYPAAAQVFLTWGMHCVGCPIARFESIADACRIYQRPLDRFLAELQVACSLGDRSS